MEKKTKLAILWIAVVILVILLITIGIKIINDRYTYSKERMVQLGKDCKIEGNCEEPCNCNYNTQTTCEDAGGKWHIFFACLAIGCPEPANPCCECPVN